MPVCVGVVAANVVDEQEVMAFDVGANRANLPGQVSLMLPTPRPSASGSMFFWPEELLGLGNSATFIANVCHGPDHSSAPARNHEKGGHP